MATRVHENRQTVSPETLRQVDPFMAAAVVREVVEAVVRDTIDRGILVEGGDPVEVLRSLRVRVEVDPYGLTVVARTETP